MRKLRENERKLWENYEKTLRKLGARRKLGEN
jgi:hypothetical protein